MVAVAKEDDRAGAGIAEQRSRVCCPWASRAAGAEAPDAGRESEQARDHVVEALFADASCDDGRFESVAVHAWRPGHLEIDAAEGTADGVAGAEPVGHDDS